MYSESQTIHSRKKRTLTSSLAFIGLVSILGTACSKKEEPTAIAIGYGADTFTIGEELYSDSFNKPEDWVIQIEQSESENQPKAEFINGVFDAYMPARGCTAWLTQKFEGPIAIVYQIKCPEETLDFPEVQARDINNFWHASDLESEKGLFDGTRYTGNFGSYHKMHAYYASTGGGGAEGNHTTRFRRYPRQDLQGNDVQHIALNGRDDNPDYLITPGKWHTVQLVAYNGLAQYIVDGKVVYEIKEGDQIDIQKGGDPIEQSEYTFDKFPVHNEGYFGLRLVRTHHQYKDLKIYRLNAK